MKFLALRLCEHDSNISYSDGKIVKYYKSERDFQIKHHGFENLKDWAFLLDKWNIDLSELDSIGIVLDSFRYKNIKTNESKLFEFINVPRFDLMGIKCPVFRIDHHLAHALSLWTLDVNPDHNFVFDGFGDDFVTHSLFEHNNRVLNYKNKTHKSFGKILAELGTNIGLKGNDLDHAGKVMALKGFSSSKIDDYSNYDLSNLSKLWNESDVSHWDKNFAEICNQVNHCHQITEEVFVNHFCNNSNLNDVIGYSGGVAQNTIINTQIRKKRKNLHIPPHCADEGISLGILEFLRIYYNQEKFSTKGFPFWQSDQKPVSDPSSHTIKEIAESLANGKIVGWYQGNGEIGSRALGNRSILMSPLIKDGKDIINKKVKQREKFRPFGASIIENRTSEFFDWQGKSEYMLYVMNILDKESFPSITHVDGTCRIQTVSDKLKIYHELISEFEELTGVPMLLNTSLNNGGKPIAGSKKDALQVFESTELDILVVGNEIYKK